LSAADFNPEMPVKSPLRNDCLILKTDVYVSEGKQRVPTVLGLPE